ncbi:hypothetical protein V6N11_079760 [Hibiscus sabdariffa]|uniref:Uncharacterized protein n=1 Tax=Hibiscus sabdariffa TaxID=183260 RepID=A0ABR2RWB8_9ROSI
MGVPRTLEPSLMLRDSGWSADVSTLSVAFRTLELSFLTSSFCRHHVVAPPPSSSETLVSIGVPRTLEPSLMLRDSGWCADVCVLCMIWVSPSDESLGI